MQVFRQLWQKSRVKHAVMALGAALLILIGYGIYQSATFRLVGTDPAGKNISILAPYISFNFNKQLSSDGLSVIGTDGLVKSYETDGKRVLVYLNYPLALEKSYNITIESVMSAGGQIVRQKTVNFVPKDADASKLTPEQEKAIIDYQNRKSGATVDPIMEYMPHGTLNYSLDAAVTTDSNRQPKVMLEARLLLTTSDQADEAAVIAQYKKEIVDYIRSLGFNPDAYDIQYTVSAPYLRGSGADQGE